MKDLLITIYGGGDEAVEAAQQIAGLSEIVPQDDEPGWIPVEDRLPESGEIVLVWHHLEVKTAWLNHFTNGVAYFVQKDTGYNFEPTHWMPLPEPPKCATH